MQTGRLEGHKRATKMKEVSRRKFTRFGVARRNGHRLTEKHLERLIRSDIRKTLFKWATRDMGQTKERASQIADAAARYAY